MIIASACKVQNKYQQPDLGLPQQYRAVATADTSTIADVEWKQFFTDTTLQNLISKGIAYNNDLLLATQRLAEASQRLKQARLLQLPDLNLQLVATTTNPSNNSLNGVSLQSFLGKNHVEDYTAALNLSWEADIWGKLRNQKEIARAQYLQTYEGVKAVQTQVVASIAQGYYNLAMLDAQLQVAKKNLLLNDSVVQFTQLQRNAGEVTSLAVEQAVAQQQSTALLVPQIEQDIAIQENALSILVGAMPDTVMRYTPLMQMQIAENLAAGVPSEVVSRRPDVRASEMALLAANAQVGVAQAYLYPALVISATGGVNSFKASNWFAIPASLFGTAAGSLTQPIFQRRQLKTNLEIAKIQREQSVTQFRQSVLLAVGEVSDALVRSDKLKQQQTIATAQVDTLQLGIRNARLLFRSGMANYLEVITAQANVLQAELNLTSIRRQRLSAVVELYRAVGGGWK